MKQGTIKGFVVVSYETIMSFLFMLPRYRTLNKIKRLFLVLNGARIGKRVVFYPGVWITPGRNLKIGDDVDLALNVQIETSGGVTIGDRTLVGYGTKIFPGITSYLRNQDRYFAMDIGSTPFRLERMYG